VSATNRGGERITADNYPTPKWVVDRLLDALPGCFLTNRQVIEPCAGEGSIVKALAAHGFPPLRIDAIEVRVEATEELLKLATALELKEIGYSVTHADALADGFSWPLGAYNSCVITNPPFEHAERFIQRALSYQVPSCFLERVGFGQGPRAELFRKFPPSVLELPERVSFAVSLKCTEHGKNTPQGECDWVHTVLHDEYEAHWKGVLCPGCGARLRVTKTDATGYAWYCWNVWKEPRYRMLAATPKEVRANRHG
jgi:predicted RNA methylase